MSKFFKENRAKFIANLPFKIAALLIAFGLWFFVLNVIEPVTQMPVSVRLEVRGVEGLERLDSPVFLENQTQLSNLDITVLVRGTQREITAFYESMTAYIDLSTAYVQHSVAGTNRLSVNVNVTGNTADVSSVGLPNPSTVELHLDNIITRHLDVELNKHGYVLDGFILIEEEVTVYPPTLAVTGPSRVVNRISRLIVDADIDDSEGRHVQLHGYTPRAVDANDESIGLANVRFSSMVDVYIPIYQRGTATILVPGYDAPAPGFGVSGVTLTQSVFPVFGTPEALANLTPIVLEQMQLGSATADLSRSFVVNNYLPNGVYLIDRMNYRVTAHVYIEPVIQRSFNIARESVSVTGVSTNFQILTDVVTVTVSGLQSVVANMSVPTASINLAGLEYGNHNINLNIALPQGAQLIGSAVFLVQIGDDDAQGLQDTDETEPPETTDPDETETTEQTEPEESEDE